MKAKAYMRQCPFKWKEKLTDRFVLNDYEHMHKGTIVHECQLDDGHNGPHECPCGAKPSTAKRSKRETR